MEEHILKLDGEAMISLEHHDATMPTLSAPTDFKQNNTASWYIKNPFPHSIMPTEEQIPVFEALTHETATDITSLLEARFRMWENSLTK